MRQNHEPSWRQDEVPLFVQTGDKIEIDTRTQSVTDESPAPKATEPPRLRVLIVDDYPDMADMPVRNGMEAAGEIRKRYFEHSPVLIALTGNRHWLDAIGRERLFDHVLPGP